VLDISHRGACYDQNRKTNYNDNQKLSTNQAQPSPIWGGGVVGLGGNCDGANGAFVHQFSFIRSAGRSDVGSVQCACSVRAVCS